AQVARGVAARRGAPQGRRDVINLAKILSLDDFEHAARRHLPRPVFEYVSGGVEDNASRRDNRAAFEELGFVPRVLVNVSKRTTAAGFRTLVVTVDVAILSNRENNVRAGFAIPMRPTPRLLWDGLVRPRWTFGTFLPTLLRHGIPHLENNFAERGAPILSRSV